MQSQQTLERARRTRRALGGLLGAVTLVAVLAAGCDNPLDTEDPDIVRPEDLDGPEAVSTLVNGALGDFAVAFAGNPVGGGTTEGVVMASGLLADEWILSGTFPTRLEVDTRNIEVNNGTMTTLFRNIHVARAAAERAAGLLEAADFDPSPALNLEAYTYIWLAENYCSGVPISETTEDGGQEFGQPLTTPELYDAAMQRFTNARDAAQTSGDAFNEQIAMLGMARIELDRGNFATAGALAAMVPTGFRFDLDHSINTERQENGIYSQNAVARRWTPSQSEGTNGLPFMEPAGGMDVRVPTAENAIGVGFDQSTPQFDLLKYPARDAESNVGSGIEARLIEAEAALQANDPGTWLTILNELRANVSDVLSDGHREALLLEFGIEEPDITLDPLADPGTPAARVDMHFRERAFWLYSTATRLSDLRRLVRQYGRDTESVFPTGTHFKGDAYGPDVNFPVPFDEQNNPNFEGCINRQA